jgi:hypothetical protein
VVGALAALAPVAPGRIPLAGPLGWRLSGFTFAVRLVANHLGPWMAQNSSAAAGLDEFLSPTRNHIVDFVCYPGGSPRTPDCRFTTPERSLTAARGPNMIPAAAPGVPNLDEIVLPTG